MLNSEYNFFLYLQEFDSVESAQRLMEDHVEKAIDMDGTSLMMQYSSGASAYGGSYRGGGHAGEGQGSVSSGAHDWICPMCRGINFFRCVLLCAAASVLAFEQLYLSLICPLD